MKSLEKLLQKIVMAMVITVSALFGLQVVGADLPQIPYDVCLKGRQFVYHWMSAQITNANITFTGPSIKKFDGIATNTVSIPVPSGSFAKGALVSIGSLMEVQSAINGQCQTVFSAKPIQIATVDGVYSVSTFGSLCDSQKRELMTFSGPMVFGRYSDGSLNAQGNVTVKVASTFKMTFGTSIVTGAIWVDKTGVTNTLTMLDGAAVVSDTILDNGYVVLYNSPGKIAATLKMVEGSAIVGEESTALYIGQASGAIVSVKSVKEMTDRLPSDGVRKFDGTKYVDNTPLYELYVPPSGYVGTNKFQVNVIYPGTTTIGVLDARSVLFIPTSFSNNKNTNGTFTLGGEYPATKVVGGFKVELPGGIFHVITEFDDL